jgi:primary-amine oxidase
VRARTAVTLGSLLLLAAVPRTARAQSCSPPYLVEQRFPATGAEETRWRICWQMQKKHGLVITSAHFRKAPGAPFLRVFWDARVAEIFVPYHDNSDRFYDIQGFNWPWVTLLAADCPASLGGTLLGGGQACKVVHDRGLAWKDDQRIRRGQELVLWGAIDAANYNYLVEWTFRDDGVVMGRVAATGLNYPPHPRVNHTHDPIWRLDIDLDGFQGDSVYLGNHTEGIPSPLHATDSATLVSSEMGLEWDARAYTALHIHDATLKNDQGHSSAYHLMPLRWGTPRHEEPFTWKDLWVTRYDPSQVYGGGLPGYVIPPQPVADADVVLWYTGSVHHLVRDEDGVVVEGHWQGEAHAMWTGFMLKPHDLFDGTPLCGTPCPPR